MIKCKTEPFLSFDQYHFWSGALNVLFVILVSIRWIFIRLNYCNQITWTERPDWVGSIHYHAHFSNPVARLFVLLHLTFSSTYIYCFSSIPIYLSAFLGWTNRIICLPKCWLTRCIEICGWLRIRIIFLFLTKI